MNTKKSIITRIGVVCMLLALPLLALISTPGCETTTARQAGEDATLAALLVFDDPEDAEVFERAKLRIDAYLATGQPITEAVIDIFADWLASELDRNPAAVRLVVRRLKSWVVDEREIPPGQPDPARAFVEGVSDTLGIAFN